jgi:hypothetical protein
MDEGLVSPVQSAHQKFTEALVEFRQAGQAAASYESNK